MNRYWDALARCSEAYAGVEFGFRCPLKFGGVCTPRASRFKLAIDKQISYPLMVRRTVRTGIAHILDHSYAYLLAAVPAGVRTIVTVHDLLPLREPDGLSGQAITRFRKRVEWVKKADLVLADSLSTQGDLIELIGVDARNIIVLPLGADVELGGRAGAALPAGIDTGFLFSIGGYMKRKNLEILPQVLEIVRRKAPGIKLVRAGGKLPVSLAEEFHRRCGEGALVELGQVSDETLSALYQNAAVTIIPSRYEGFGLPVLEAMARGCPVVCARTTSLPEVGGEVALYFEVDDADGAAQQLLHVLDASPLWLDDLKSRGWERAAQFTWDIHFKKLLEIYRGSDGGESLPTL